MTIGETTADNGGLKFAYEVCYDEHNKSTLNISTLPIFSSIREFKISLGQTSKRKQTSYFNYTNFECETILLTHKTSIASVVRDFLVYFIVRVVKRA